MSSGDPTAKAAIHVADEDVLGSALTRLTMAEAQFIVLREGYEVPMAALVRLYKVASSQVTPNYDYLRHVHHMLTRARQQLADFLSERGVAFDELDWHGSRVVRDIGARFRVDELIACGHCGEEKIPVLTLVGRPRAYCSDACRQAAYRRRRDTDPAAVAAALDAPEQGMLPCFAGMAGRIPADIRYGLVELVGMRAVTVERILLSHPDPVDHRVENALVGRRWSPNSPLLHAARAALSHLVRCGADLNAVFLHGRDLRDKTTPHSVGFECRYLRAMPNVFVNYGGAEWIEVPRVSRTGPLPALRVEAVDRDLLRAFRWP